MHVDAVLEVGPADVPVGDTVQIGTAEQTASRVFALKLDEPYFGVGTGIIADGARRYGLRWDGLWGSGSASQQSENENQVAHVCILVVIPASENKFVKSGKRIVVEGTT